jgi:1,4-alpha-glucan branching enzyme
MNKRLLKVCLLLPVVVLLLIAIDASAQLLTSVPSFIKETDNNVEIIADASKGNQGLLNHTPVSDVYVHIGVITNLSTSPSNWRYVPAFSSWGTTNAQIQATSLGSNKWKYTIPGNLRSYFGISDPSEKILKIAILFRNGAGNKKLANADGSDMYVPVYEAGLYARIDQPYRDAKFYPAPDPITVNAGDAVTVTGVSSETSALKIYHNTVEKANVASGTSITTSINAVSGDNQLIVQAFNGSVTKYDTLSFFVNTPVITASQPAGTVDGINYLAGNTSVTLVLYAPNKTRAAVIGDFNGWTQTASNQMYRTSDGNRYWITITGLTPGTEYAFQYLVDGTLRIAEPYAEKILDPSNDPFIPAATYPSLKPYPSGQTGIVSVLQTQAPAYTWVSGTFTKPNQKNLGIYELLLRDFVAAHDWQTLKDTLLYLKRLGINVIEIMPFNEFEGNSSWGYNPSFYFAPDKYYGTKNSLKQFVDVCHQNGVAVIMDIVLNHTYGTSPLAQLYWDAANNRPAANNPWYNTVTPHAFDFGGSDFNHESTATKNFFNRVLQHWINEYRIDGYRFDFSKGLTNKPSGNDAQFSAYDATRVTIINQYATAIRAVDPNAYVMLEHFTDNSEEMEFAMNSNMLIWGNLNYNFNEATKGVALANSNFQWGIHVNRGYTTPNLVTYMESHDEERLMYRNLTEGNIGAGQNTRDINNALKRMEMAAAFFTMIPGPKMIWQFGELGYDQSINRCENGTINNGCRTNPKPILWNYKNDPNRNSLYMVYARLFALRRHAAYEPTFISNNVDYSLSGGFKWLKVTSASLRVLVIGNFDVFPVTGSVAFQTPGTWYNYLGGGTFTATGSSQSFTLQPGEYYVYVDRDASAALPLTLLSFNGRRETGAIELSWMSTNENIVSHFEVERSLNGTDFTAIAKLGAKNGSAVNEYALPDASSIAVKATGNLYYRLKMTDKDGKFSYSKTILISPSASNGISFFPNPVKNGTLYLRVEGAGNNKVSISIQDVAGRIYRSISMPQVTGNIAVDVKGIAAGMYFLKTEINGIAGTYPLIIEN